MGLHVCLFDCANSSFGACCQSCTQTCVFVVHRFVARRGQTIIILFDIGMNFFGDVNEFKEAPSNLEGDGKHFAEKKMKWSLNPPAALQFFGVWKRPVRSCKKAN